MQKIAEIHQARTPSISPSSTMYHGARALDWKMTLSAAREQRIEQFDAMLQRVTAEVELQVQPSLALLHSAQTKMLPAVGIAAYQINADNAAMKTSRGLGKVLDLHA